MKQLSARRFRLTFPDITEPVLVITRTSEGYRDLGTWTPAWTTEDILRAAMTEGVTPSTPETKTWTYRPKKRSRPPFTLEFNPAPRPSAKPKGR